MLARRTDTLTSVLLEHKVREADSRAHNPEAGGFESLSRYSIKQKGKERNAIYSSDERNESDKENPVLDLHSEKPDTL